jgi:hypothetical protein
LKVVQTKHGEYLFVSREDKFDRIYCASSLLLTKCFSNEEIS